MLSWSILLAMEHVLKRILRASGSHFSRPFISRPLVILNLILFAKGSSPCSKNALWMLPCHTIETQVGSFFVRSRSLPALLDYLLGHRCRLFTVLAPDVVKRAVSVHMTEQLTRLICGDETVCRPLPCEIDTAARWRWRIVYNSWMNKKAMAESGKATCAIKQERPQLVWRSVHPPH